MLLFAQLAVYCRRVRHAFFLEGSSLFGEGYQRLQPFDFLSILGMPAFVLLQFLALLLKKLLLALGLLQELVVVVLEGLVTLLDEGEIMAGGAEGGGGGRAFKAVAVVARAAGQVAR